MASANIFQNYLQPVRSVEDYQNDTAKNALLQAQVQNTQGNNALLALTRAKQAQEAQQGIDSMNAIQRAYAAGGTPEEVIARLKGNALSADRGFALEKEMLGNRKTVADTGKSGADAAHATAQANQISAQTARDDYTAAAKAVLVNPTQEAARKVVIMMAAKYGGDPTADLQQIAAMTSPDQIKQWAAGHALTAEQMLPKTGNANLGGNIGFTSTDPITGKVTITGQAPITQSADNKATNASHIQGIGMQQAGENARSGMNADGTLNTGNNASLVDMLGNYQLDPKQALARAPLGQRAALIAQIQAKYPGWDETTYDAKKGAAGKFTYGSQGDALRSVSTANAHLDQLGELADAMKNGNIPVINKVQNWFSVQTGQPAVTNFDSIKSIVGQEVVKAIVAGGGTGGERDKAEEAFNSAKSPQQLAGVISHYRAVMGAQARNLLEQRRAAGLPDSTLPQYSGAAPAASQSAAGWTITPVRK